MVRDRIIEDQSLVEELMLDKKYADRDVIRASPCPQVRTSSSQADAGADVLLDWFSQASASTVAYQPRFLKGLTPSAVASDFLRIGGAVYCADKVVKRADTQTAWTRDLALQVPVSDVRLWERAKPELDAALCFLSGDRWDISFVQDTNQAPATETLEAGDYNAVSLFSGGLESLAGVIDRLEAGERLVLVGHHDSPLADSKQKELYSELLRHYGATKLSRRALWLRPAGVRKDQARVLPSGIETTTRSRSFLFIAAGVAVADALGASVPLYVPENGFIGINVPLTLSRAGSLSTRTTHPLYMHRMERLLALLGLPHAIENPYRLSTKGELLDQSANKPLLLQLAPQSVSCSHPEALRWLGKSPGNCGCCFPCLIRRASMHHVGADAYADYGLDALSDTTLLDGASGRGRSLRALTLSLRRAEHIEDVLINGRVPNGETPSFFDVYRRGRAELREWLKGAGPELAKRL